jgi:hypothetical protein
LAVAIRSDLPKVTVTFSVWDAHDFGFGNPAEGEQNSNGLNPIVLHRDDVRCLFRVDDAASSKSPAPTIELLWGAQSQCHAKNLPQSLYHLIFSVLQQVWSVIASNLSSANARASSSPKPAREAS